MDYRLAALGSLLPDLVDKPLSWLSPAFYLNSRTFGHTVAFGLALLIAGVLFLRIAHSPGLLVLALASTGHLVFDGMWAVPGTLLWPLYGSSFPYATESWPFSALPRGDWPRLLPDIIGGMVIGLVLLQSYLRGDLLKLVKTGTRG